MSTEPFTDELLSAIIDGEADAETVASVNADPVASARLAQLQHAVDLVSTPVPDATPERRSASIAAAMAAAQPSAPEVTSLTAARHERRTPAPAPATDNRQWLALVAAAVVLVVAIPLALQFRSGSDSAETATDTAADATSDSPSFAVDDAAEESADAAEGGDSDDAGSDAVGDAEATADDGDAMEEAAEDDAMEEVEDSADDAMEDEADDAMEDDAVEEPIAALDRLASATVVDSVENIDEAISFGSITPLLTLDQVVEAGLSPACVDQQLAEIPPEFASDPLFDIVFLDQDGLSDQRLIIVRFNNDETTTALDAEDCAPLG